MIIENRGDMRFIKLIFCLVVVSYSMYAQANDWQLVEDDLGIKVFRKNSPDSQLDLIKAEAIIEDNILHLASIMGDIENFSDWMFACIDSHVIGKEKINNFKLYYVHETPWPYKNRDVVLDVFTTKDEDINWFKVAMKSVDYYYASSDDLVRMESMNGNWYFQKVSDVQTKVSFELFVDPSGNVPFPFVNSGNVKVVLETFKGLKRLANSKAYLLDVEEQESKALEKALIDSGIM